MPTLQTSDFLSTSQAIGSFLGKELGHNNPVGKKFQARWRLGGGEFTPMISGTIAMTKTFIVGGYIWVYLFPVEVDAAENLGQYVCHPKSEYGLEFTPVFVVTNSPGMKGPRIAQLMLDNRHHELELEFDRC